MRALPHLEAVLVRVPYTHAEVSSLVARDGVTDVIVKLTADDGLVGWGECTRAADAAGIASAVEAMRPILLGRDPFDMEAIVRDVFVAGAWQFQPMTGAPQDGDAEQPTLHKPILGPHRRLAHEVSA